MMPSLLKVRLCLAAISLLLIAAPLIAQPPPVDPHLEIDTDHDGLSDALEQHLLDQFAPTFLVSVRDCSRRPAEFKPDRNLPEVQADNGTIYGQVFPAKQSTDHSPAVEIHFYHLWRRDCGGHGHPLDTEHVAVLVRASDTHLASATWKAVFWYAAAHENTVCDVSQIARASTLHAEANGATVWISPGKHASYLNETLCQAGCGADRCENMVALAPSKPINLGELGTPMNGSAFTSSSAWPLAAKMSTSNFPPAALARLNQLPETDIAWFHPGRHPAQGIIATSSSTEQALAKSRRNTTSAISLSGASTSGAVSAANDSAGNALQKSYRHTRHAIGASVRHVGNALQVTPKADTPQPH